MAPFRVKTQPASVKIKNRMMELFETTNELKIFFHKILPANSLLETILEIDKINDKNILCDTILSYLGDNFFVYVGKVRPDEEKVESGATIPSKRDYDMYKKRLDSTVSYSDSERDQWKQLMRNYEISKGVDPTHIVREEIIEQYLKYFKDDSPIQRQKLLNEFNSKRVDDKAKNIKELSQHPRFLSSKQGKGFAISLCDKYLLLPTSIIQRPESEPKLQTTEPLRKNYLMPRLYDFQVESLLQIHNMLNNEPDPDKREQRILLNLPTGAGKTRLTVQAIIEWLNNRERGLCENAHDQQKQVNGKNYDGIIFWFASTNELCTQASESFKEIFSHIGIASQINLTNWFGDNRGDLKTICEQNPGTHIVITNTAHTSLKLKEYNDNSEVNRYLKYLENSHVKEIREKTIAIVIDEAHEVGSNGYQNFLGAMGFDFYKTKRGLDEKIYNTQNIVLIGLTATPYKGSGVDMDAASTDDYESFGNDLEYMKSLDAPTRKIHHTFGGIYIPLPDKSNLDSPPTAIIDMPRTAREKDKIKIDGSYSYDHYSTLKFFWKIYSFERGMIYETSSELDTDKSDFYFSFRDEQKYTVELTVINESDQKSITHKKITIKPKDDDFINRKKSLSSTKEFYQTLTQDKKILCKIIHGVISGPTTDMSRAEERKWKLGSGESDDGVISNDVKYNKQLCDIVDKCRRKYHKDRILIFANGVKHSQELMLILKTVYGHKDVESIDGKTKSGIRRKIVNKFKKGKIHILCNFAVLTTGFDVPEIDVVIIARDVASNSLYTQMIGRGQRGRKAGGTDDVWLITSKFPRRNNSSTLQLGWEALAEDWEHFEPKIKDDLDLQDYSHETSTNYIVETKNLKKDGFILNFDPLLDLKLKCQSCGIISQGFKNCLDDYNYTSTNWNSSKIQKAIESMLITTGEKKFKRTCKLCRVSITEEFRNSKCKFTNYLANHHQLNPILILMMKCIYEYQQKSVSSIPFETLRNDFKNYMQDDQIPNNFITHTADVVINLVKQNFIKINPNFTVQLITKITDVGTAEKIIKILEENENFKIRLSDSIKNYKRGIIQSNHVTDELDDEFDKLKQELGHIPTKRQYENILSVNPELKTKFQEQYDDDYLQFLNVKRKYIRSDEFLRDSLYDEYFAKCIAENSKISHEQLDETGDYRIEDYLDIWTTVEKFEKKVHPIIESVLKNRKNYLVKRDSEFKEIGNDILQLKKDFPGNYFHFGTINNHSSVHVFRYIIQLKISHLRFLRYYDGTSPGIFLQLVSDFFKLKDWIGITPTIDEFIELTDPQPTNARLMELFGIDDTNSSRYSKFLKLLSINSTSENIVEQKEIQKQLFLVEIKSKSKDKQSQLINSTFDWNDKLSVQMKMYYPDKKELKKLLDIT